MKINTTIIAYSGIQELTKSKYNGIVSAYITYLKSENDNRKIATSCVAIVTAVSKVGSTVLSNGRHGEIGKQTLMTCTALPTRPAAAGQLVAHVETL